MGVLFVAHVPNRRLELRRCQTVLQCPWELPRCREVQRMKCQGLNQTHTAHTIYVFTGANHFPDPWNNQLLLMG